MTDTLDPALAREALSNAVQSAFTDMTFIDAAALKDIPAVPPSDRASIDMLKPLSLRLEIAAGPELRGKIAEILFGNDNERNRDDAFLELVNVAAGVFLSNFYGAKSEVRLELPTYLYGKGDEEGDLVTEVAFDAEGATVVAALRSMRYRY